MIELPPLSDTVQFRTTSCFFEYSPESPAKGLPWCPVVKTPGFHCKGSGISLWSGNLRSHMLHGAAEKKTKKSSAMSPSTVLKSKKRFSVELSKDSRAVEKFSVSFRSQTFVETYLLCLKCEWRVICISVIHFGSAQNPIRNVIPASGPSTSTPLLTILRGMCSVVLH